MKSRYLVISTSFAMFSMFFGSGNLVFPLTVGRDSGGHFLLATIGIVLTGVIVPFLGVLAMMLFKGDTQSFFGSLGKPARFWLPFVILSLMGPFGVLARCLTVAHGSFRLLFPDISMQWFSLISCVIIFLLTINKNRIIPLLGSLLTPFLLASLGLIIGCGYWFSERPGQIQGMSWNALKGGIFQGYQTMDLLAAFFFSTFVINHLEKGCSEKGNQSSALPIFLKATLLGAGLLSLVYCGLVYLGSVYAGGLSNIPPEEMLGVIAFYAIGKASAPIVCMAVVLACFTTAFVLATLFAEFLQKEVVKEKIDYKSAMVITLVIAFFVSTLEFAGIARILGPILEVLYPALIVLTMVNAAHKLWGFKSHRWPVALTLLAKICTI